MVGSGRCPWFQPARLRTRTWITDVVGRLRARCLGARRTSAAEGRRATTCRRGGLRPRWGSDHRALGCADRVGRPRARRRRRASGCRRGAARQTRRGERCGSSTSARLLRCTRYAAPGASCGSSRRASPTPSRSSRQPVLVHVWFRAGRNVERYKPSCSLFRCSAMRKTNITVCFVRCGAQRPRSGLAGWLGAVDSRSIRGWMT